MRDISENADLSFSMSESRPSALDFIWQFGSDVIRELGGTSTYGSNGVGCTYELMVMVVHERLSLAV